MADPTLAGYELDPETEAFLQSQQGRQQLANLLTQRGMQSAQGQQVGRFYVPPSWTQGLSQLGHTALGAYLSNQGRNESLEYAKQIGARHQKDVNNVLSPAPDASAPPTAPSSAAPGTPAPPSMPPPAPPMAPPASMGQPPVAAAPMTSMDKLQQQAGTDKQALQQAMLELQGIQQRYIPIAGSNPLAARNIAPIIQQKQQQLALMQKQAEMSQAAVQAEEKLSRVPASTTAEIAGRATEGGLGRTAEMARTDLGKVLKTLEDRNIPVGSQEWMKEITSLANKLETHPAGASQTVNVDQGNPFFKELQTKVGEEVAATAKTAKGSLDTLRTVDQIRGALDSGKVTTGPGTTPQVYMRQLGQILGVGGKSNEEVLTNTRQVIQGLAKVELDTAVLLRGQGQVSDAERKLVARASLGDISTMSIPEVRTLMGVLDKTARFKIAQNEANVQKLKGTAGGKPVVPFMEVQQPPPYASISGSTAEGGTGQLSPAEQERYDFLKKKHGR